MADTVVVVESAPSAPSIPSAPSAPTPDHPSDTVVAVIHDDARDLGYALARIEQQEQTILAMQAEILLLAGNDAAQAQATASIVDSVEEIADAVEDIEPGNQLNEDSEPQPEDSAPGKPHWLNRSGREWVGK